MARPAIALVLVVSALFSWVAPVHARGVRYIRAQASSPAIVTGTLTYTGETHFHLVDSLGNKDFTDETRNFSITYTTAGTTATGAYHSVHTAEFKGCGSNNGIVETTTIDVTINWSSPSTATAAVTFHSADYTQVSYQLHYSLPTTATEHFVYGATASCPIGPAGQPQNKTSTVTPYLFNPPLTGVVAGGSPTLTGSVNHTDTSSGCLVRGTTGSCSVTDTLTWNLKRDNQLRIVTAQLLNQDVHPGAGGNGPNSPCMQAPKPTYSQLEYLSTSPHEWLNGKTPLYANLTLKGNKDQEINDVVLRLLGPMAVGGIGHVDLSVRSGNVASTLTSTFGATGTKQAEEQLVWQLGPDDLKRFDHRFNADIKPIITVTTTWGDKVVQALPPLQQLVLYQNYNHDDRFGGRDPEYGGDSWATPRTRDIILYFSDTYTFLRWNDFSRINGGHFCWHEDHLHGTDTDGYFNGYDHHVNGQLEVTKNAGKTLVRLLNDAKHGRDICYVYVTWNGATAPFWQGVEEATHAHNGHLDDGRPANAVITYKPGHKNHFHAGVCH